MRYALRGQIHGQILFVESKPERCPLRGTMGDYGYTPELERALLFDSEPKARWHAARVYGFDGHHAAIIPFGEHATHVGRKNERNK